MEEEMDVCKGKINGIYSEKGWRSKVCYDV
jgi:hypothetical protein